MEVSRPLVANYLNGQRLRITRATIPLTLRISGKHQEEMSLLFLDNPHSPVVQGHPWMAKHRPEVDWDTHQILGWGAACATRCLSEAHSPMATLRKEEGPDLQKVPVEYRDLGEVFSKARATCLPPHRPYGCAIVLKPGTSPPRG